tara:strand:+ start:17907 stop:18338 length:432 start_codon:yes stop_codon:yes gene_type:complete
MLDKKYLEKFSSEKKRLTPDSVKLSNVKLSLIDDADAEAGILAKLESDIQEALMEMRNNQDVVTEGRKAIEKTQSVLEKLQTSATSTAQDAYDTYSMLEDSADDIGLRITDIPQAKKLNDNLELVQDLLEDLETMIGEIDEFI